jgi:serine/threonine-protein kinase
MKDRVSAALSGGTAAPDPLIGRDIGGRFKITALIARGGMGKVYRAEQAPLGRICAVKVLTPGYAGEHDPEFHKRFFLEASIASRLTHPNTVTIFDYGRTDDDVYYMVMEYLEGLTLHRAIRDAGYLPEERTAHIARQICRALREAHAHGVIHRDLKPANIFLVEHGDEPDFVKILDFGLVKDVNDKGEDLTQTGLFMGSPKYMSPEQIRGDRVDGRTDVYALGIILYEMLTGKVPFDRLNSVNILMAHVHEQAPAMALTNPQISVSPGMTETVARCLDKNPETRFRSMDEVLAALKRVSGGGTEMTGEPSVLARSGSAPRTHLSRSSHPPARMSFPSDSPGTGLPSSAAGPGKTASKGALAVAVLGALALVAVIVALAVHRGSRPVPLAAPEPVKGSPAGAIAVPAAETAATALAPPAVAWAPSAVKVRITTDPDGAMVKEDGAEVCSSTPCDLSYKGDDADPAREHKLTITRQGYRGETRSVKAGDSLVRVKLTATLAPRPVSPAPDTPAVPKGYKSDIPY